MKMLIDLTNRIKSFLGTEISVNRSCLRFVLQFFFILTVFYFAIFEYTAPSHEIARGIVEFFLVAFSLCTAIAAAWLLGILALKWRRQSFQPRYWHAFWLSLAVYTLGMGILYCLKELIYDIQKAWFWRYYWRHLPYALLGAGVFLRLEHKNALIDALIERLNVELGDARQRDGETGRKQAGDVPFQIVVSGMTKSIAPFSITHVTAHGHYLDVHYLEDQGHEQVCIRKTLGEIMEELPPGMFLRTHRSHAVNHGHISGLNKKDRRYFVKLCGDRFLIPISRNHFPSVVAFLENQLAG
ncbi:LytTR family DNA-binding domain-containing protein [Pseudodesulfovibrio karagichevae]|uniref:LytTR family DNA-binding domain-containing protein n=1 Tax=Pseudodesulfovibrio karagichevae TaxID=3239305 RepID=A0ABV4K5I7_9BACT